MGIGNNPSANSVVYGICYRCYVARTCRGTFSQGYDSLTAHKTPRGISMKTYPIPGYRYEVSTEVTELSGKGMKVVQKSQKFRVGYGVVQKSQNSPGYGYESRTEVTELFG